MALCTATAVDVLVYSLQSGKWVDLEVPNSFTMKLFDCGSSHLLKFNSTDQQRESLQLKLKATTYIQRHHDSHSKYCEVNHENSVYLLKFAKENACEVFVMAINKAIDKEKDKASNRKSTTAAVPGAQHSDSGYDSQMHTRPRVIPETDAYVFGPPRGEDYHRSKPQPRNEWSSGDNLPDPYRMPRDNPQGPYGRSGDDLPASYRLRGDLPAAPRQRPSPNDPANYSYPPPEPMVQYVDYQEQSARYSDYPEQPPRHPPPVSLTQGAYYRGEPSQQSEAAKVVQGNMSAGDLNLWLYELTEAINGNNQIRAHEMVDRLMQYPKHVGQVSLSGICQEKKEPSCDSPESDCIRLRVTVESQQSSGKPATIVVQARRKWKVKDLKLEVEQSSLLPREVQKWIIGKHLARDEDLVDSLVGGASEAEVFMYVVKARKGNLDRMNYDSYKDKMEHQQQEQDDYRVEREKEGAAARTPQGAMPMSPLMAPQSVQRKVHAAQSPLPVARPRREAQPSLARNTERSDGGSRPPIFGIDVPVASPNKDPVGWKCLSCTFVNKPARPGCEMCSANRPADYQPPLDYEYDDSEKELIRKLDVDEDTMRRNIEKEKRQREVEREKNFLAHQATDYKDIIENIEAFECRVCTEDYEPGEGVMLRECLHMFCKDCLRGSILNTDDAEVRCPFAEYECNSIITEREIRGVLTEAEFEQFEQRGIAKAEAVMKDSFHCQTADCPGWCVYEDDVNDFPCPICNKTNCLLCKAIHEGMNCKEYQDDINRKAANDAAARATKEFLERMLTQGDAMRCSQCGVIVQKKEGCDWIRCSVCKTELCWATKGPRWGPKGRGDITGGCKCGVKGVKCTPRCGNCH